MTEQPDARNGSRLPIQNCLPHAWRWVARPWLPGVGGDKSGGVAGQGRTKHCTWLPPAFAPASLRLPAAGERQR